MAYRRGDNDRPEVLGHGFIEATTWREGMSGDHNMHQKPRSYLDDFECPRCGHCCKTDLAKVGEVGVWGDDEPVAWVGTSIEVNWTPIYTEPPKRKWQGLTLNEAEDFYEKYTDRAELINAIDKFLEEKNT
jgi:hypothetical protein